MDHHRGAKCTQIYEGTCQGVICTCQNFFSSFTWLKESLFQVSSRCLQKVITSQGCQTQQWCRPMRAHVKLVILSVPFPEVQNRKGTESGRCQRTFKEYRHSKILVPIPTCGIFPCWIAVHRIDNAGDLFLFRDKKWNVQIFSEMYKRPKKCTKFGCALIVIFATKVCVFCNF